MWLPIVDIIKDNNEKKEEKKKAENAVEKYWSKHMSLYRAEMPQEFKDDWVYDLLETADVEFNDDDVRMSFQRMIMTTVWDFYDTAHSL